MDRSGTFDEPKLAKDIFVILMLSRDGLAQFSYRATYSKIDGLDINGTLLIMW